MTGPYRPTEVLMVQWIEKGLVHWAHQKRNPHAIGLEVVVQWIETPKHKNSM